MESTSPHASDRFDRAWLELVERRLSAHLGPVARVVLRRTAAVATSADDLITRVGEEIEDERQREHFVAEASLALPHAQAARSASSAATAGIARSGARLGPEVLARAERELARIVGPIAGLLVRRYAGEAASEQELFRLLAREIDDPGERKSFLLRER